MRRRILLLVVGMTTLVVLAFAIPLVVLVRNNAYDDGVRALTSESRNISGYLRGTYANRTTAEITAELANLTNHRRASVELPDGRVLGDPPPGDLDKLPPVQDFGFGARPSGSATPTAAPGGQPQNGGNPGGAFGRDNDSSAYADGRLTQTRVLAIGASPDNATFYTVRVYATDDELHSGETGELVLIVGVAVGLLVVGVLAGEILTRRIVRPLVDTSETAQRLAAGDVTARATTSGPGEVADVGRALNRLADRIDQLIAEERETVADLSHRLRTPMTALRLDAEALSDHVEAERIGTHVTALERMLTAVIRAARRPQREGRMPSCEATAVVGERVEFWSALAEDQGREVTVSLPDAPVTVRAGEEDLGAAVDALLENVIAHTPEGTSFGVRMVAVDGGAELTIGDDGPGLPDDAAVRGRRDRGSTGLGLDIARRCAESSGGSMTLGSTAAGGALVTLVLGAG